MGRDPAWTIKCTANGEESGLDKKMVIVLDIFLIITTSFLLEHSYTQYNFTPVAFLFPIRPVLRLLGTCLPLAASSRKPGPVASSMTVHT